MTPLSHYDISQLKNGIAISWLQDECRIEWVEALPATEATRWMVMKGYWVMIGPKGERQCVRGSVSRDKLNETWEYWLQDHARKAA